MTFMMHHKKKRMSKEKNQRYHAKIRMLQHYGKQITNYDLERMGEIYRHSVDTVILSKNSNRTRKALITYKGEVYPIVYDKIRHQIVTVLNVEYLTPAQRVIYENLKARTLMSESKIQNTVIPENVEFETEHVEESVVETDPPVEEYFTNELTNEEERKLMEEAFNKIPNFY